MIIDDSLYKRPRSQAVEYLGRQYDHSSGTFYRGFCLLSVGWSDGHSFVPVELELLTNATADKRIGPDPDLDSCTHAGRRCKHAFRKATEVAMEMIERSQDAELPVDYVVFDNRYGHPKLIRRISQNLPVVCMVKNHPNFLYRHDKRIYTLGDLYRKVSDRKRSKDEGPIIGSITVLMLGGIRMRIVFVRDQHDLDKWLALASSDMDITPERICRIYAKRWVIGVSSQGHLVQSVEVRPGLTDSGPVAWEALWRESKRVKPSDSMLETEHAQRIRLQRTVNTDVGLLHANPVVETVDNARRQQKQGWIETSPGQTGDLYPLPGLQEERPVSCGAKELPGCAAVCRL